MGRWKNRPEGSNWGDFGPDDQIGRMNLLTPALRRAAGQEIREGIAFTLSLPLDYPGGDKLAEIRKEPKLFAARFHNGTFAYNLPMAAPDARATDIVCDDGVVLFTQYSTQWDSLAHWGRAFDADGDGQAEFVYYNGYRAAEHFRSAEDPAGPYAFALGIENFAMAGVQGRGVLIDLKRAFGGGRTWVGYDDLMRTIDAQGVEVRAGDFVLFYTGYDEVLLSMKKEPDHAVLDRAGAVLNGHDRRLLKWIEDSGAVALCSDNMAVEGFDMNAAPGGNESLLPLHELCLFKQGIHLGELWYLKDLAAWLGAHQRHAFFLTAPPLRLPGSVGSPATPIATV